MSEKNHDRKRDIKRLARMLRDGSYNYNQTKSLISDARELAGLTRPADKKGSVDRLNPEEFGKLMEVAYEKSGTHGLMIRTLLQTGSRVEAFTRMKIEDVSFSELEIRVEGKGNKTRDIPIMRSLANELRLHLGDRDTGYVFVSRQGGHYTSRRIQQIVREFAEIAGIKKNVYPHLLRHTIAQHLADQGMPENLLQKFLGHDDPSTTQVYYEPRKTQVKEAFSEAMGER